MDNKESLNENEALTIRKATIDDLATIVTFAVALARQHVVYDRQRFNLAHFEPAEESHTDFMAKQLQNEKAAFLVAELEDRAVGYAFLRMEPASLGDLLNEGVWLHDIFFEKSARGRGLARRFFDAVLEKAKSLGSNSLMLTVSPHNLTAQKFFAGLGFRPTMQEMRIDFETNEVKQ